MTRCNSTSGPLNAAGDIVGYGVLAAFLGSALVTIAAVVLAYYHDAIDDDLITDLDHKFISEIRSLVRSTKEVATILLKCLPGRIFRQTAEHSNAQVNELGQVDLRIRRTACFNQFLLSLSDQQLVTGLALLIVTVSSQEKLSGYEFAVAHSLAWFSSTTHLATLDVLRPTLRHQNQWLLNIRVTGVTSVLILLTYTSYRVSQEMSESKLPASCTKWQREAGSGGEGIARTTLALLIIWGGYVYRLLGICLKDEFDLWTWITRILPEKYPEPRILSVSQRRAKALANRRCNILWRIKSLEDRSFFLSFCLCGLPFWAIAGRMMIGAFYYNQTFLSTIPMIFFSFSYGICQVAQYAFRNAPELTEEAREMGFGQLIALLLLLLPCLAAGAVFSEYQNEKSMAHSTSINQNLDAEIETMQDPELQQPHHPYDRNFEFIRKYLFTTVEDPSDIPEARRDLLVQLFEVLRSIENRRVATMWPKAEFPFALSHTGFGVILASLFVTSSNHWTLYISGLGFFLPWILYAIPNFISVVTASFRRSPAQEIYVETELLVQERQRMLSIPTMPESIV